LTKSDQRCVDVLTRLINKSITLDRAAQLLGLSSRQVRRKRDRFLKRGVKSLVHGNRGKPPHNALPADRISRIRELSGPNGPYHDFNVCHMQALLAEREGLCIGRSTLQKLLHPKPSAVPPAPRKVVRQRRLRSGAEGLMVQIDGSLHDWLEGRGPKMCLIGSIDDATGKVPHAHFQATEDATGYLLMMRTIAVQFGLPMSYYHDKHTILRSPKKPSVEDELAGLAPMSQVQRVMHELGIESIIAHSPQAKGRIERLWKTFQDRLTKEMRLAGIATREEANAFLPGFLLRYNAQFAVEPADPTPAWVPLEPGTDLDYYFSVVETRTVKEDHTICFDGKTLQIVAASRTRSLAGNKITVRINAEGEMALYDRKQRLEYRPVPASRQPAKPLPPVPANPKKQPAQHRLNKGQRAWLYAPI